ncbi:MAG: hypothetical protein A3K19_06620 [Lentisphaerae bacterium RIFOXYB12_FULL_65_16]|nr:MAG: hypothetical protein A3K18_02020 [Lentisphaerae bacterium RIFOXYA12_64_32]OGV93112.1 MAG: hypothetical protein A3K19_06620 [Lentisphaerae bacterium RIFOXYB12_FULL_65_16]
MAAMTWMPDAEKALSRVPAWVRHRAARKVEKRVLEQGRHQVTLADVEEAEKRFRAMLAGKSPAEIQQTIPQDNTPAAQVLVVETCHGAASDCPNLLADVEAWGRAIEEWATRERASERLRARIDGDQVLYHHKFRISVAGCPNACSRPQIADVGLIACVKPTVASSDCTACGVCARACPDRAITVADAPPAFARELCLGCSRCRDACPKHCIGLSQPEIRVVMGGKLGRHPRLGQVVGQAPNLDAVLGVLNDVITTYSRRDVPNQRFSDFWAALPPDGRVAAAWLGESQPVRTSD